MSINYYIRADPRPPCKCCGHVPSDEEVHLGQAAGGWQFLFKGNRDSTTGPLVTTEAGWWAEIQRRLREGQRIWDEYGQEVELEALEATVNGSRTGRRRYTALGRSGAWQDQDGNCFLELEFS